MWEPWATGICDAGHSWRFTVGLTAEACPTVPYVVSGSGYSHSVDFDSTISSVRLRTIHDGSAVQDNITYWEWNDGSPVDNYTTGPHMKIKMRASISSDSSNSPTAIEMFLMDIDDTWVSFLIAKNAIYSPSEDYTITDNGGEEQILVLSDYGLSSNLYYIGFAIYSRPDGDPQDASLELDYIDFGDFSSSKNRAYIRYRNLNIPRGSVIESARAYFTAYGTRTPVFVNVKCGFNDTASPVNPTSKVELDNLKMTSETIEWTNIQGWGAGNEYVSPDLSASLQEVIDRPDWPGVGDVMLILEDNGSTLGALREFYSIRAGDSEKRSKLCVEYSYRQTTTTTTTTTSSTTTTTTV